MGSMTQQWAARKNDRNSPKWNAAIINATVNANAALCALWNPSICVGVPDEVFLFLCHDLKINKTKQKTWLWQETCFHEVARQL